MNKPLNLKIATNQNLVADMLHCLTDGISFKNWHEDVLDEPTAYPYTAQDLDQFLTSLKALLIN